MSVQCQAVAAYYTRCFKYDRDDLCANKSQFVPVIFEPPCTLAVLFNHIFKAVGCCLHMWGWSHLTHFSSKTFIARERSTSCRYPYKMIAKWKLDSEMKTGTLCIHLCLLKVVDLWHHDIALIPRCGARRWPRVWLCHWSAGCCTVQYSGCETDWPVLCQWMG